MHWRWKKLSSSDLECLESSIMNRCIGFVGLLSQEDPSLFKDFCKLMFVSIGLEASIICPHVWSHSCRVGPKEISELITMSPSMRATILKSKWLEINSCLKSKGNPISFWVMLTFRLIRCMILIFLFSFSIIFFKYNQFDSVELSMIRSRVLVHWHKMWVCCSSCCVFDTP